MRLLRARGIQPPDPIPTDRPGDPNGIVIEEAPPFVPPPRIPDPQPWAGWPAEWATSWGPTLPRLTDTAWLCLDLNASVLSTMPPYLVGDASSLDSSWLTNPEPDVYTSWEEFGKQLFWDYMLGEAFVLATAYYATGWPARFHVVPPWAVNAEIGNDGRRTYSISQVDVTPDLLHIRYKSSVDDAHGHGPLEAGGARLVAADVLTRYSFGLASSGGIPSSILEHPDELTADQTNDLKQQWITARLNGLGEPAVLSGGVTWKPVQVNPTDMALTDLLSLNEARIAVMLGVPPFLVGLPIAGGESVTYANATSLFDYHWRAGLRPKATAVMAALSGWLLPRGTSIEVNKDAYVQPDPKTRAETAKIYLDMGVLSIDEIRAAEKITAGEGGPIAG